MIQRMNITNVGHCLLSCDIKPPIPLRYVESFNYSLHFQVFASDKDKDINILSYSFVSGNEQGNFSINQTTGEITLAKPLDRESTHQVILTVRAKDSE